MHDDPEPLFEHLVRALVSRLSDGVLVTERDGTILWVSQSIEALLGIPAESLVGTNAQALLHPEDAALSRYRDPEQPVTERPIWHETRRLRHADGSFRLVDRSVVDLTDDPEVRGWGVILRRASPRLQAFEHERRLAATVEHTQDIVLVYGSDLELLYASPSSRRLAAELDGTMLDHLDRYVDAEEREIVGKMLERLLAAPGAQIEDRLPIRTTDGQLVWVEMRAVNLLDDAEVRAVVLNGRDITEQVALEERLRHDALHDPLTGVPNRPHVMAMLEAVAGRPRRPESSTAVLYLDLDRFKVVNDSFGHATGDLVLVDLAQRLQGALGDLATVGRFGGDEYVILATVAGTEDAVALAEIVARQAGLPFTVHGPDEEQAEVYLSASIGIALAADGVDAPAMLHHADAAMYRAKATGGGGWELYDEGMRDAARARLTMETELARALDEGDFELHYQPIIDVRSRRVGGFEALARWRHPDGHMVSPEDFVPVAEETGGIHHLGAWALTEACQQLKAWEAQGIAPMSVSVNVSPTQLTDLGLARHVARALASASIDPSLLCLEITETVLVDDLDRAVGAITRLRDLGVRLALDDFGTGWSSLTHLRSVPVDVVKIDKSFVDGLTEGGDDRAIVGAVVTMCRALGKTVVAEGVETEGQFLVTRELGCTHAQGWLIAKALPAADVPEWLRRYRDNGNRCAGLTRRTTAVAARLATWRRRRAAGDGVDRAVRRLAPVPSARGGRRGALPQRAAGAARGQPLQRPGGPDRDHRGARSDPAVHRQGRVAEGAGRWTAAAPRSGSCSCGDRPTRAGRSGTRTPSPSATERSPMATSSRSSRRARPTIARGSIRSRREPPASRSGPGPRARRGWPSCPSASPSRTRSPCARRRSCSSVGPSTSTSPARSPKARMPRTRSASSRPSSIGACGP